MDDGRDVSEKIACYMDCCPGGLLVRSLMLDTRNANQKKGAAKRDEIRMVCFNYHSQHSLQRSSERISKRSVQA